MKRRALAIGLALVCSAGCAVFRAEDARSPTLPPQVGTPTKSVSIALIPRTGRYNGEEGEMFKADHWARLEEATRETYINSNLFYEVAEHYEGADLRAEIEVSVSTDSVPTFAEVLLVTGLGILVPLKFTETFHMHTTFKNEDGEILAETDGSDRLTTWVHLFAVFLAPGHGARDMQEAVYVDLNRAALSDVHARGVF